MDSHDSGRSLSRYASDLPQFRATAAKMLVTYLGSLSGTLTGTGDWDGQCAAGMEN